jgi:hypothetical protein
MKKGVAMQRDLTNLEVIVNGRHYMLLCASDSPLEDVKEVCVQLQTYICNHIAEAKSSQEQQKQLEEMVEVTSSESESIEEVAVVEEALEELSHIPSV